MFFSFFSFAKETGEDIVGDVGKTPHQRGQDHRSHHKLNARKENKMEFPGETVLVFSPHADDSDIGLGGTIARLIQAGKEVTVVLVTASTIGEIDREVRCEEFREAQKILGCKFEILGWDIERALQFHNKRLIGTFEALQRSWKAYTWFIPAPSYHQDHRAVFEACISAARPTTNIAPKILLRYETHTSFGNPKGLAYTPDCYFNITEFMETKLKAVVAHKSQMEIKSQPYMNLAAVRSWAEHRGFQVGVEYAEAFQIERMFM